MFSQTDLTIIVLGFCENICIFEQKFSFCHSVICHSETTAAAKTINQGKSGATFPFDLLNANLIENAVGSK